MLATLEAVVDSARRGNVVSFPTDTVPAVAVLPDRAAKIYRLKQRPAHKPLILMADTIAALKPYVEGWQPQWQREAERAWPGPLTLVLPASDRVPVVAIAGGSFVGIRIPDCADACELLSRTGPLATTSANISGEPPLVTAAEIAARFPDIAVLDRPFPTATLPSTVVRWCESLQNWELLRQGAYQLG